MSKTEKENRQKAVVNTQVVIRNDKAGVMFGGALATDFNFNDSDIIYSGPCKCGYCGDAVEEIRLDENTVIHITERLAMNELLSS